METRKYVSLTITAKFKHFVLIEILAISEEDFEELKKEANTWMQENQIAKDGLITHHVKMTDTLQGLSIRYGSLASLTTVSFVDVFFC